MAYELNHYYDNLLYIQNANCSIINLRIPLNLVLDLFLGVLPLSDLKGLLNKVPLLLCIKVHFISNRTDT